MAEVAPYRFTAPLSVALDVKNPHAFLAVDPTYALVDELRVDVEWLPVVGPPLRVPPSGEDRGSRHRRARAIYRERDLQRYAEVRGLTLRNIYRAPDSTLAGMGLLAARARSDAAIRRYLDIAFEGHWRESLDIEDEAAIAGALAESGVDPGGFVCDRSEFDALQESLRAAGLFDTPAYVVEGELFLGRAHLPMIRWILRGRAGPAPI
jgi:2-hydroxychromene-2-carboxylate isomerase